MSAIPDYPSCLYCTRTVDLPNAELCNGCWEIEHRIEDCPELALAISMHLERNKARGVERRTVMPNEWKVAAGEWWQTIKRTALQG